MAGVGRRAFAAAAQVAFFTSHRHPGLSPTSVYGYPGQVLSPTSPVDGRLSSLSGYLNISTDVDGATPSSARLHSPEDDAHSPGAEIARANSRSPSPVDVIDGSGSRSASKGKGVSGGLSSLASKLRNGPEMSATAAGKQPLRTASPEPMDDPDRGRSRAISNARSEAESETELAYGSWRSPSPPADRRKLSVDSLEANELKDTEENTIAFPRRGSNGSDHAPKRTGSQSSGHSSSSSGSHARRVKQSAGSQTLSALREEEEDDICSAYTSPSSAEVDGAFRITPVPPSAADSTVTAVTAKNLADMDRLVIDDNRLNLPARSKTSASASSYASSTTRRKRIRTCAKCEKRIDDGRWVKIDDGNGGNTVLCEQDWKMLYLPKCRQCGLAIETQAIYASDGQLKGKYHKECFNCYTCHKPFPDRSFYVYQERPYCMFHYHEANNSLCASPTCREPIEGHCAVSHSGARYHPEHFTCEYEDDEGRCMTLLKDYWEISGESMCERHALRSEAQNDKDGEPSLKAKKRQTRFLDIRPASGTGTGGQDLC